MTSEGVQTGRSWQTGLLLTYAAGVLGFTPWATKMAADDGLPGDLLRIALTAVVGAILPSALTYGLLRKAGPRWPPALFVVIMGLLAWRGHH